MPTALHKQHSQANHMIRKEEWREVGYAREAPSKHLQRNMGSLQEGTAANAQHKGAQEGLKVQRLAGLLHHQGSIYFNYPAMLVHPRQPPATS